jgi:hypothetical protein
LAWHILVLVAIITVVVLATLILAVLTLIAVIAVLTLGVILLLVLAILIRIMVTVLSIILTALGVLSLFLQVGHQHMDNCGNLIEVL